MWVQGRLSVAAGLVAATLVSGVSAPPQVPDPRPVAQEVHLAAAPAWGAIPLAFVRNQFQNCTVICPYALQGAITVPLAIVQIPVTFLGSLATTGSVPRAIGSAAASVTGALNAAVYPIITNDLSLVLPRAQHVLNVAIVEAFNVAAALATPAEVVQAVQLARSRISGALDEPLGPPGTPTGARTIFQVVAVEAVNVASAVVFQAGELALLGVVQTVDAAAQELARSGDPSAALAAGVDQARQSVDQVTARVVTAVDTAVRNVGESLREPFPASAAADRRPATRPVLPTTVTKVVPRTARSARFDYSATSSSGRDPSRAVGSSAVVGSVAAAASSGLSGRSTGCCSNDNATPRAKKNRMNSGPPR
jgi:hypothetical protein